MKFAFRFELRISQRDKLARAFQNRV